LKEIEMQIFQTTDLYLASALEIMGFRLIDLKRDEKGRGDQGFVNLRFFPSGTNLFVLLSKIITQRNTH